jgi:hypothetical protein
VELSQNVSEWSANGNDWKTERTMYWENRGNAAPAKDRRSELAAMAEAALEEGKGQRVVA